MRREEVGLVCQTQLEADFSLKFLQQHERHGLHCIIVSQSERQGGLGHLCIQITEHGSLSCTGAPERPFFTTEMGLKEVEGEREGYSEKFTT